MVEKFITLYMHPLIAIIALALYNFLCKFVFRTNCSYKHYRI